MTVATMGPVPGAGGTESGASAPQVAPTTSAAPVVSVPHAASVFFALDDRLRLVFLSQADSIHGLHIGRAAPVAVTVTEQYADWEQIQGVQLWGTAKRVTGPGKVAAMAVYVRRFPFVEDVMAQPRLAAAMRKVAVYRIEPQRIALTDNTTGVFGRQILDLKG